MYHNFYNFFEVGSLYCLKKQLYLYQTGYDELNVQPLPLPLDVNTTIMALDNGKCAVWHTFELKVLVGDRIGYFFFDIEREPVSYVEKVI